MLLNLEYSAPSYEVVLAKDLMVEMRDGVHLATDIYRPAMNGAPVQGRFPTILIRTPYNKDSVRTEAEYFAKRGYVSVVQDCRGRFKSEGEFYLLKNEGPDGYDTIEWIAKQPWSNGLVATTGTSYLSWVQSALAVYSPPHLKAMMPNQGGWNAYKSSLRHNGAFEMRWMSWAFIYGGPNSKEAAADPNVKAAFSKVTFGDWLTRTPIKIGQSPLRLAPNYEKWFFDILTHSSYDDYWKQPGFAFEEYVDQHADVPIYCTGGWYDSYTRSTTEMYEALSKKKKGPVRLLMGPWSHGGMGRSYAGDVDFGSEAALDWNAFQLRWFDHWLKKTKTGLGDEPPIRIFVMGGGDGRKNKEGRLNHGGKWRFEEEWPIARARYTRYYLHGDMSLSTLCPPEKDSSGSYQYDPRKPVPTIGGNISAMPIVEAGAFDQREREGVFGCKPPYLPLSSRHDILVFSTPPLEEELEVTGPLVVKLWASSSAVDTDFTVKLVDEYPPNEDYPDGYAMNLSDSIIRARYRNSWEKEDLMEPGEIYEFSIILYPTSNLFQKSHRIRLDISSSNYPRFDLNPNTGEPLGKSTRTIVADNTVYHEAQHPSHIILPIIPPDSGK